MKSFIPVYDLNLTPRAKIAALNAILSGWISSNGSYVTKFESAFSQLFDKNFSITCCNGTAALHLALFTGVKKNDVVVVPSFTYIATVNAIRYCNAHPLFVDIDPSSWQLDLDLLDKIPASDAQYVLLPHIYGACTDMARLLEIINRKKWILIEDCAESLGSNFIDKPLGTFGDAATFSFFGNKTISTGEGGMIITKRADIAERCKFLRSHAMDSELRYWHTDIGYNYRLNNIASAIGFHQLKSLDKIIFKKMKLHEFYQSKLAHLPIKFQHFRQSCLPWMSSIIFESIDMRNLVIQSLNRNSIGWRPLFYPAHTMPMYSSYTYLSNDDYTSSISTRGISIPSHPSITKKQKFSVVDSIVSAFR